MTELPRHVCVLGTTALLMACSSRTAIAPIGSGTMPDPGGCYVLVYDRAQFMGVREFINGPRKYPTLTDLPFRVNWRQRIRSADIGPRASVTMWADAIYKGASETFAPGTKHPVLFGALNGRVESMDVTCPLQNRSDP